jgi:histidine ammonia-lyase
LNAKQGLAFRKPNKSSVYIENLLTAYRNQVSFMQHDRIVHDDIMKSIAFMNHYEL